MAEPRFLTWQELLDQMISFLPPQWRANFTGKVLKRLMVAFALVMEGLYGLLAQVLRLSIISTSEGIYLRELVAGIGMETYGGIAAIATVQFRRWSNLDNAVTIPAGTEVRSESGLRFTVNTQTVLPAGETEVDVTCTCTVPGEAGNVLAGRIIGLTSALTGIDEVSNRDRAVGGANAEAEGAIRARVPLHLAMLHRATIPATEGAINAQLDLFPEVVSFITERQVGTPGYFRGILADASGGDRYRVAEWIPAINLPGVYYAIVAFPDIFGLVEAGWPCQRFGDVERDATGREVWVASLSASAVGERNYRWYWDASTSRLYARADGSDLNGKNLTVLAEVTWKALEELEQNWMAAGVGCDVLVPFTLRIDVRLSFILEPGAVEAASRRGLQDAVSAYISSLEMGAPLELDAFFAHLNGVDGAGSVEVASPAKTVQPERSAIVRAASVTIERRG